jgi:hypothetical protein
MSRPSSPKTQTECQLYEGGGGALIILWLYKENKQLDWQNVFNIHMPPWAPHTYDFIALTSLTNPRNVQLTSGQCFCTSHNFLLCVILCLTLLDSEYWLVGTYPRAHIFNIALWLWSLDKQHMNTCLCSNWFFNSLVLRNPKFICRVHSVLVMLCIQFRSRYFTWISQPKYYLHFLFLYACRRMYFSLNWIFSSNTLQEVKLNQNIKIIMFLGNKVRLVRKADNLTAIFEPTV